MQATQRDPSVVVSQVLGLHRIGHGGQVRGGKGEDSTHDKVIFGGAVEEAVAGQQTGGPIGRWRRSGKKFTLEASRPMQCSESSYVVGGHDTHSRDDGSGEARSSRDLETGRTFSIRVQEMGRPPCGAMRRVLPRYWMSTTDPAPVDFGRPHQLVEDCPYNRTCSCAWCSSG